MSVALSYTAARFRSRPARVLLAGVGIAAASAMVGAAITVAWSLSTGFDRSAAAADLPDAIATFDPLPRGVVAPRVQALPNLRAVGYRLSISGRHISFGANENRHATVVGVQGGRRGYAIVDGRDFAGPGDAVVESGLARSWHLHAGDSIDLDGFRIRVAGIAVSPDTVGFPLAKGPRVWVPYQTASELAGAAPGSIDQVLLWVRDPARLDVTLSQARMASYGISGLTFVTRTGVRSLIGRAGGIVIALLVGFSVVALVSAGAMLAAAAAADVQRRLASIGVLRAVGASARGVAAMFALEAAAVAAPAAALGLLTGWLLSSGPTGRLLLSLNELSPGASLLGLLAAALVAIVGLVAGASAWPAFRAARRPPVETLRGGDIASVTRHAPAPSGVSGLGLRLALARPRRTVAVAGVLAVSAAVVLLILAVAAVLARLHTTPAAVGKRYELSVGAPASQAARIARISGVERTTSSWTVDAADSFDLGEPFTLVAYQGDHTLWEAPPLATGRRIRSPDEAEVGLGLAQALDLHPGATLAAQVTGGGELRFRVVGIDRIIQDEGRIAYVEPKRLVSSTPWLNSSVAVKLEPGASGSAVEAALAQDGYFAASSGGVSGEAVQGWAGRNGGFVSILVALLRTIALLDGCVCLYVLVQMLALTAQERRRSLAVVRAVGASRRQLGVMFAVSALTVALVAAPVAVLLERRLIAPFVARLAASYVALPLGADAGQAAIMTCGLFAAALAAAWWVAGAAASGPVVTALREE